MQVNFKKLDEKAVVPSVSKPGDAGLDLTAVSKDLFESTAHGYVEYGTGIAVEIPEGFVGLLFPRSSISNTGMILANSVAVIDSGYRGELKMRFKWIKGTADYNVGDRIGQLVIMPYPQIELVQVEELAETARGAGAFGSSGN